MDRQAGRTGSNRVGWIVDPLDGTVNFLYGLPVVSVSIAATIDGCVVAGAVADVYQGEVYSAAIGGGAHLGSEPLTVSDGPDISQALVGTGFSYNSTIRAQQAETLVRLLPKCRDIRCMGSAALNLCWVGSGALNGYYERDLKPYDFAAGVLSLDPPMGLVV
jgi:myo-inositol-1(or 4)-monophosphatase